jgi:hypothetical protein
MTRRLPVTLSPGPLEDYALRFDDLLRARAQREGFRRYLFIPLCPRTTLRGLQCRRWSQLLPSRDRQCSTGTDHGRDNCKHVGALNLLSAGSG